MENKCRKYEGLFIFSDEENLKKHPKKEEFLSLIDKKTSDLVKSDLIQFKQKEVEEKKPLATRKSSQNVLDILLKDCPFLLSGSADLAGACYTKPSSAIPIHKDDFQGNYIHYGIREHAMGAIMNGIAAYGAFLPLSSTFLSFVDYMKPALRLAALMQEREIYILTHDSLGVGEDGPTHQPIEQLAMLRAIPNVTVFRPADSIETAECYELALQSEKTPCVIVCSRQELPVLRKDYKMNMSALGAYVISESKAERDVT